MKKKLSSLLKLVLLFLNLDFVELTKSKLMDLDGAIWLLRKRAFPHACVP